MIEVIYLEPDEDIAGAIARVKALPSKGVSLVIPRGGSIAQSVVNLKLLKREIEKMGKSLSLVTKDPISKNLASQVGITVFSGASEAKNARLADIAEKPDLSKKPDFEGFSVSGIQVNQYKRETDVAKEDEDEEKEDLTPENNDLLTLQDAGEDFQDERQKNDASDQAQAMDQQVSDETEKQRYAMAHAEAQPKKTQEKELEQDNVKPLERGKKNLSQRRKPIIILSAVFAVILLSGGAILYPSANAKITLKTTDLDTKGEIVVDKSVQEPDLERMIIPAKEYTKNMESTKDFSSTGKKDVGEKASGEVTFYNSYDIQNPIVLPDGLAMVADGKTFYLSGSVTIPKAVVVSLFGGPNGGPIVNAGSVKGNVVAKDSGESSNIGPSKFVITSFSGQKQANVYGQSASALSGGTTREVLIVSEQDINNAKTSLVTEMEEAVKAEFSEASVADNLKLISSSFTGTEVSFESDKKVGDETNTFNIKMVYGYSELAFSEDVLKQTTTKKIESTLKENEILVNNSASELNYDLSSTDNESGKAVYNTNFVGKIGTKIDTEEIKNILVRAKYGSAESKIESINGVLDAQISLNPSFWPFLPLIKQRISVNFDYQKE